MHTIVRKSAAFVALAATVAATVMRIVLTPQMQDANNGSFHLSYAVIALMVAAFAAVLVLILVGKGTVSHAEELSARARLPLAVSALAAGGVLATASLFDSWLWLRYGITPPPNDTVISPLDAGSLALTLIFGILGGFFLLWLGIAVAGGTLRRTTPLALAALSPVLWIWFRLVRYELSYASAVQVSQSFYDFVMLIFTMLFLFSFARHISGTGEKAEPQKASRMLLVYSLCTAIMSISGPITSIVLYMTGETAAYNASRLAGFPDLGMGVFALCTALVLLFARPIPAEELPEETAPADEAADGENREEGIGETEDPASLPAETAEDILNGLRGDYRD